MTYITRNPHCLIVGRIGEQVTEHSHDILYGFRERILDDDGAELRISTILDRYGEFKPGEVSIGFSYQMGERWYGRRIKLDLKQIIELRNYLSEIVDEQALKK